MQAMTRGWTVAPSKRVSWTATVLLAGVWAWLRLVVFSSFIFPLTYALPLLLGVWTRDKGALWSMAAFFAAAHSVKQVWILPPGTLPPDAEVATYAATMVNILLGAGVVHAIIVLRDRLEGALETVSTQAEELARQNEELAQQNEELAQQGEELQTQSEEVSQQAEELSGQMEESSRQNEELQAQAEEISALNEDLGQREALLEGLLDAARVSGTEETALREVCAAGVKMFGSRVSLVAVYEKQGDRLLTRASAGPDAAKVPDLRPSGQTFADLVMQENRPAALADASLRPDLVLPPIPEKPRYLAVLAAPMTANGLPFGALVVYAERPQEWTERHFTLAAWLARQCGSILQLLRLQQELREADRRKNDFLATLSHELRNPLAPIRYAVELLNRPGTAGDGAGVREVIERQLAHMVRLVDDLLDVTRIASNKIRLRTARIQASAIVQAAVEAATPEITRAGHQLEVRLPASPLWLNGDPDRLSQVLINLLTNAARYTPAGGRVTVSVTAEGDDRVVVSVRDTGIGLGREHLTRVFEMFTQVGDAGHGGLGIGLALVKGLVELHGGTVQAVSEGPGAGAEFQVRLPRVPAPVEALDARAPAPACAPARRILVVDDNTDSADMLRTLLEVSGHEVHVAYEAEDALRAASSFRPDIGLFDIGLPGMNGYELARKLRRTPDGASMFLVAITGWGQEEDRQRAKAHGFDAHLTKPADPDALERLIASAVGRQPEPAGPGPLGN